MNIVRTDWDLVQIATYTPQCLKGLQSQKSALRDPLLDFRASGVTEGFERKLQEQVVKLVLPPEDLYFSQSVDRPMKVGRAQYDTPAQVTKMMQDIARANY